MKRIFLIAGGTVGGLGAVLAITPPQLTSTESTLALSGMGSTTATQTPAATPAAQTPTSATSAATATTAPKATAKAKATPKATAKASTKSTTKATATQSAAAAPTTAAPAPVTTTAAPATSAVNGTFTGNPINVQYGTVQVRITVVNGKITDAQAVQAPTGRNDRYTNMSVPVLRQRTLAAQGSNITGVSGASYTSYGWYTSLVSALAKAKM